MKRNDEKYQAYIQILKEELVPAMGCTEPIALAYAAAKAREGDTRSSSCRNHCGKIREKIGGDFRGV